LIQRSIIVALACLSQCPGAVLANDEPLDEITVLATRRPVTVEEVSAAVTTIDGGRGP
jgi:hypothetical protein